MNQTNYYFNLKYYINFNKKIDLNYNIYLRYNKIIILLIIINKFTI